MSADSQGKVFVDPLVEEIVSTPQDVVDLLSSGNNNRKTGATDWVSVTNAGNASDTRRTSDRHDPMPCLPLSSSLGHATPTETTRFVCPVLRSSTLLVQRRRSPIWSDEERANTSTRGELTDLNSADISLLALREVVHKLTEPASKRSHIPYRNSKLTHLLENVLGGDSNICVICTMSADEEHCPETMETLKFARRCSQVETKAQKNIVGGTSPTKLTAASLVRPCCYPCQRSRDRRPQATA